MEKYFQLALRLAKRAAKQGEVPIGAVVISRTGEVLSQGFNRTNRLKDGFQHAEIRALRQAQKRTGDWRLEGAKVYVTLEPCLMCLGAMALARVDEVVFALEDPTFGSLRTVLGKTNRRGAYKGLKYRQDSGIEWEVRELMKQFFVGLRQKTK